MSTDELDIAEVIDYLNKHRSASGMPYAVAWPTIDLRGEPEWNFDSFAGMGSVQGFLAVCKSPSPQILARVLGQWRLLGTPAEVQEVGSDDHVCGLSEPNPVCCGGYQEPEEAP